ncbi:MAG: tetratricopeptide repeat protein [Gammaproteobacteria bacterium]|nr:tetratricopeptide repeat protein [Gammaproteobacteria bacterium]
MVAFIFRYSGTIMKLCQRCAPRPTPVLLCLLGLLPGVAWCATGAERAAADERARADANAEILSAEVALQAGDCLAATREYGTAILRVDDAALAGRAAGIALDCARYDAAQRALQRWRGLAPDDADALRTQLRLEVARERAGPAARTAAVLLASAAVRKSGVAEEVASLGRTLGPARAYGVLARVRVPALEAPAARLALGELALDGWRLADAARLGAEALQAGAAAGAANALIARARAGLGDASGALAAARAARAADAKGNPFAEVDVLELLGRDADARAGTEALREHAATRQEAERRLAIMAFNRADLADAQQRFAAQLQDPQGAPLAIYYLAAIAERRGDRQVALRGYALLGGTALASAARHRAARLLLAVGERERALSLLAPEAGSGIGERLVSELESAQLLFDGGDRAAALEQIEATRQRFPGHPEVLYQRAILLERAGRTSEALQSLEQLHRARPADGTLTNALGFILADHRMQLPRAESLIRAALESEPDNPAILDSLGWVKYRRGAIAAALPVLERAWRLFRDGDIAAHYGEAAWASGDQARARAIWSQALAADPDNTTLQATVRMYAPQLLPGPAPSGPVLDPTTGTPI